MGVLKGFERRLEGAVEGMFARLFKSGLQPIELAQGVERYAIDHRQVTSSGVVVCNDYRIRIHPSDADRLSGYGESLPRELANVVRDTADAHDWQVPGDVRIDTVADDEIAVGRLEVVGRVRTPEAPARSTTAAPARTFSDARPGPTSGTAASSAPASSAPASSAPASSAPASTAAAAPSPEATQLLPPNGVGGARPAPAPTRTPDMVLEVVDTGHTLELFGGRYVIGRLATCDLPVDSTTVSREHAAMVKRNDTWWVVDLGSTNGTKVNGIRASEQPVRTGDRIEVGTIDLTARKA